MEGTYDFCGDAQQFLMDRAELKKTKLYPHATSEAMCRLAYCGRLQVARIHRLLYKDATIWLSRKREIAEPYLSAKRANLDFTHVPQVTKR